MFHGWGYMLGEIWVLIALAALIGLFVGWLIWGRQSASPSDAGEVARLQSELVAAQTRMRDSTAQLAERDAALSAARATASAPETATEAAPEPTPVAKPTPVAEVVGSKPTTLDAPRDGQADDLKKIKGIGPKLEALCNRLGFWHYDQIAAWSDEEIAWVDANLETFKGRVTRDNWVAQARDLMTARH